MQHEFVVYIESVGVGDHEKQYQINTHVRFQTKRTVFLFAKFDHKRLVIQR